jgi:hypothetical protein
LLLLIFWWLSPSVGLLLSIVLFATASELLPFFFSVAATFFDMFISGAASKLVPLSVVSSLGGFPILE